MAYNESYFSEFREKTLGRNIEIPTPYGVRRLVYADWTASGRMYEDIERKMHDEVGPYVANTHTEASFAGIAMTEAYHLAADVVRQHIGAADEDVILPVGTGSTGAINKLQRIMGLKIHERWQKYIRLRDDKRPVVFITHMEHHSNHTSWLETIADVVVLPPDERGLVSPHALKFALEKFHSRRLKIGSFTACSNVTGIRTPYQQLAKIMHRHGGLCFVDFAASAPYDAINMHPEDSNAQHDTNTPHDRDAQHDTDAQHDADAYLDAIFFSPHKFLGGPSSCGILAFHSSLYHNRVPDQPGGGTVDWTNPWGGREYVESIAAREDGGTPGFLQFIRAALAIRLKEKMGVAAMNQRDAVLTGKIIHALTSVPGIRVFADDVTNRLGIISFSAEDAHYNLFSKLLSDRYGIQTRAGCHCAGTYGHYLLDIDKAHSEEIKTWVKKGDFSTKPGWVRVSLHPTMTDGEVSYIVEAIRDIMQNVDRYKLDYTYSSKRNAFVHKYRGQGVDVEKWFVLGECPSNP
jgi:selenocysteine lyase/cysteine desulfurase